MKEDREGRGSSALTERLRELFETVHREGRGGRQRTFSSREVAEGISADPNHGVTVSRNYVDGLRNGRFTNPTAELLAALVAFFNDHRPPKTPVITVSWLIGEETSEDRELRAAMDEENIRAIAMRSAKMDPELQGQILDMVRILGGRQDPPPSTSGD